jgi:hypothetical protein
MRTHKRWAQGEINGTKQLREMKNKIANVVMYYTNSSI